MTLRSLALPLLLIALSLGMAAPAGARSFTSDERENVRLFLDGEGWVQSMAAADAFRAQHGIPDSYKTLLAVLAWEQKHPREVSFEEVRQLFCLAVSMDMGVSALKNVIETSTSSEGKRLARQLLAEELELQSRTMVPEEAAIRLSAWIGLTPEEYGEAYKRVVEASIVLLKSMQ